MREVVEDALDESCAGWSKWHRIYLGKEQIYWSRVVEGTEERYWSDAMTTDHNQI